MSESAPFRVIIIGAGLAGSLLANGLIRHDIDVQVYERLPADSKREGYQIRLGAAALKGMRACLSHDELQRIVLKFGRANGSRSEAPVVYNEHFKELLDLSRFPTYTKSAPISRVVLRDALAAPVVAAGKLKYGCPFTRYEILETSSPEERVRVWFEDGSHDDCDILIGADGSHSKINKQIGLDNLTELKSHVSMIAKNELPTKKYLEMTPRIARKPVMTFADAKSLYFCAYLPEQVDEVTGSSKTGIDESLSSSMFGLHVPSSQAPEDLAKLSVEQKWDFVSNVLKGWSSEYHEIVDLVKGCDLYVYRALVSSRPPTNWRSRVKVNKKPERGHPRIWLIGDAIHAMLPNRGMGGNTSMCDTATALPLLARLSHLASPRGRVESSEVAKTCADYEAEMMSRAFEWVKKSGGAQIVPVDASTYTGRIFFVLAAVAMNVAACWYVILGIFTSRPIIDDAPELND